MQIMATEYSGPQAMELERFQQTGAEMSNVQQQGLGQI